LTSLAVIAFISIHCFAWN